MKSRLAPIAIAVIAGLIFMAGYFVNDRHFLGSAHAAAPVASSEAPMASVALPDFAEIVASPGPAVVNISVTGTSQAPGLGIPDFGSDFPFPDFFRRFQIQPPQGKMPIQGQGSGFIVSSDGVVLTNAHVVADADEVLVRLTDKREYKAKVAGIDKQTDVAVLRIDAKDLPTVKIGDPQKVRVGEWAIAIGSPFGFENSVTAGIVSAKSRSLPAEGYVPFMQTDVAINPGNSGGPLFNTRGEVIGINSQIYSRNGGYQGLSFAIPIDVAMDVERQLLSKGKVTRGRLGILIQEVNQALADSFGLDSPKGALVASVEPNSPASRAGIQPGDVIIKCSGHEIGRSSELPPLVAGTAPGGDATVEIWRQGKAKQLSITVGDLKTADTGSKFDEASDKPSLALGLAVRPLRENEAVEADGVRGLKVEAVNDGPAAKAGIQAGDVILAVNGGSVTNGDELRERVSKAGNKLALLILRGDRKMYVPIKVG